MLALKIGRQKSFTSVEKLASKVIAELKEQAEAQIGRKINNAIITVPAGSGKD